MEIQPTQLEAVPDPEEDLDAGNPWNLPSAPLPTPPPEEWPARDAGSEEGFAHLEGQPAA